MAHIQSQIKRNRQNEKRRVKNTSIKSSIRTAAKKIVKSLEEKNTEKVQDSYKDFVKTIDSAAHKRIVHKRTAARKKSRLAKRINKSK